MKFTCELVIFVHVVVLGERVKPSVLAAVKTAQVAYAHT